MTSMRSRLARYESAQLAYRAVHGTAVWGRLGVQRWALAARAGDPPARRGRILAYHSIGNRQFGVNDVRPRDFERHLQLAVDDGWSFATVAEVLADPQRPQLALTFDDGAITVLTVALPVLRHHGVPATAFVVTGWADGGHRAGNQFLLDWAGIAALGETGVRLASHSVSHPDFGRLRPDQVCRELEESRQRMDAILGVDTDEFAIPFGQSGNWTDEASRAAAQAGYTKVFAQCVDTRPAGTIARTFITRFDRPALFRAALRGAYDGWEEWY